MITRWSPRFGWVRNRLVVLWLPALVLGLYPLFVLLYVWIQVARSDLPGGRNGPLDAYRHTLASSVVAYTLDERAVGLVTRLMESGNRNSSKMDIHNNRIGARIGAQAQSFGELEPAVRTAVSAGTIRSADTNQITWLPEKNWRDRRLW